MEYTTEIVDVPPNLKYGRRSESKYSTLLEAIETLPRSKWLRIDSPNAKAIRSALARFNCKGVLRGGVLYIKGKADTTV